jgi:RND family efflux transporter MFP subunit
MAPGVRLNRRYGLAVDLRLLFAYDARFSPPAPVHADLGTPSVNASNDELSALRIERAPLRPPGRGWTKWMALVILLGAAGGGAWVWATRERPLDVEVATVTERAAGTQASVLNASGYVTARRRATVSSKVTGKVIEVNVEEGMAVREGQVLARLDDSTVRAALALAEAQMAATRRAIPEIEVRLKEARLTLDRRERLRRDGLVTDADIDQASADVNSLTARIAAQQELATVAERQVALQQAELENMTIRAPFSGVAVSKDAQPGEMVSPVSAGGGFTRTGICTIVDMRSLEVEVDVNESYINRVVPGQPVTAVLDAYPDWQIPAKVITTVPTADRQKATVLVRIAFAALDPRILPDMGVKVTFLREADQSSPASEARPVTLVPKSALRQENGTSYVFVIREGTVERHAVATGGTDGDRVEVTAGLSSGDRVVVSPPPALASGVPIVIK